MISFHFCFDLEYFHIYNFHILTNPFFLNYRVFIVTIFLFLVGVSISLSNQNKINWQKVGKRAIILGTTSLIITIVTYFIFPNNWIYFGIIHFIFLASIVSLPFIKHPTLSFIIATILLLLYYLNYINMHPLFEFLQPILHLPKGYTVDLAPFIPWFSIVLFGISFGGFKLYKYLNIKNNFIVQKLAFLGKHSLAIYLIHQPILFGLFYLFT